MPSAKRCIRVRNTGCDHPLCMLRSAQTVAHFLAIEARKPCWRTLSKPDLASPHAALGAWKRSCARHAGVIRIEPSPVLAKLYTSMSSQQQSDPWRHVQAQYCQACQAVQDRWTEFSRNAQRSMQQASHNSQQLMQQVSRASAQQLQAIALVANTRSNAPAFAVCRRT